MRLLCGLIILAADGVRAQVYRNSFGIPKEALPANVQDVVVADVASTTSTSSSIANPTVAPSVTSSVTVATEEPCAIVSQSLVALPTNARQVVPAEVALQCLRSVPVDTQGNVQLIKDLKLYLEWQSNLVYLKNPPAGYTEQPVDLMGELNSISQQLTSGGYTNEYDFQTDISNLLNRAYDNHLGWFPDILDGVFQFQRTPGTELVSISSDGAALPQVFAYADVLSTRNATFSPSAVRTINGQGVEEFLVSVAEAESDFHDADVRWNSMFPNQALIASGSNSLGLFRSGSYQGPNTTIAFENGTVRSDTNVAVIIADFSGVDSGKSFFSKFCTGPTTSTETAAATSSTSSTIVPTQTGYPKPIVAHPDGVLGGYWLTGAGYEDVAVLSIPSFESPDVNLFQSLARQFINMSATAGKAKLIFDLRGNGGGNAILGYDTFKQVFPEPDQEPFGATRFRAHEALNVTGTVTSDFDAGKTFTQQNATLFEEVFNGTDVVSFTAGFNFEHNLDINDNNFTSWTEMFGPHPVNNDSFSSTIRYNFSDPISDTYPGFSVTGFLNNTNDSSVFQPFRTENMVMLNDGMCSSTCTIVSELLKNQGGVKTIAVGGQPKFGPMQGIGGTKGAQNFNWGDIQTRSQIVYFLGSPEQQALWNKTALGKTAFASQLFTRSAYSGGQAIGGINLKDNLRRGDASQTPLEFIYEAADCRMWFTAPMISDVTMLWKGAADSMWGNKSCVQGSTGDASSISGGGQNRGGNVPTIAKTPSTSAGHALPQSMLPGLVFAFAVAILTI